MNINTLSAQEVDYKSGSLPVALYLNSMRKGIDRAPSYYARVISRGTCSMDDLAEDLLVTGVVQGFSKEQLLKIGTAFNNARLDRLMNGFTVDDGISRASPRVYGSFASKSEPFSTERHSLDLTFSTTARAKELLAGLTPVIRQGNSMEPQIVSVYDVESRSGTALTKGGFLSITGSNICVAGDDGAVGLYFVDATDESKAVRLPVQKLGVNTSSHVACVVPTELLPGEYRVKIVTQFSRGKGPRKDALSCMTEAAFPLKG